MPKTIKIAFTSENLEGNADVLIEVSVPSNLDAYGVLLSNLKKLATEISNRSPKPEPLKPLRRFSLEDLPLINNNPLEVLKIDIFCPILIHSLVYSDLFRCLNLHDYPKPKTLVPHILLHLDMESDDDCLAALMMVYGTEWLSINRKYNSLLRKVTNEYAVLRDFIYKGTNERFISYLKYKFASHDLKLLFTDYGMMSLEHNEPVFNLIKRKYGTSTVECMMKHCKKPKVITENSDSK